MYLYNSKLNTSQNHQLYLYKLNYTSFNNNNNNNNNITIHPSSHINKTMSKEKPPNIVFAFADDWGRYSSIYSKHENASSAFNHLYETPNFDKIANEGLLFLNAYVPAPTCTPCRSSLLSGQYFWQCGLGAILEGAVWDANIPTFPLEMEKAGYHIGHTYKVWSPGKSINQPIGGKRTRYQEDGVRFNFFSHWVTSNLDKYGGVEKTKQIMFNEVHNNFTGFLKATDEPRNQDKPYFYFFGPTNTHRTWEQGSGKALWGLNPDNLKGRLPAFLPDVHEVREDVNDYLGECLAFDRSLGIIMEELKKRGELDNTIIIVSGDHGIPGIPRAKCNLYDIGCEVALAIRWPGKIKPQRVCNDFVNIMDLAPTICDLSQTKIPRTMNGKSKSLMNILLANHVQNGQVDPSRDFVVTGRERHVAMAREKFLPYPQRSIRVKDFLYVINFEPDRWPAGDPRGLDDLDKKPPPYDDLAINTMIAFPDMDASPTKAWMIYHRKEEDVEPLYQLAFGKRPREELYDLQKDPHYMNNVAQDPAYEEMRLKLNQRLMNILKEQHDPRLVEFPVRYEHEPYGGFLPPYMPQEGKEKLTVYDISWDDAFNTALKMVTAAQKGTLGGNLKPTQEQKDEHDRIQKRFAEAVKKKELKSNI